jgi:hypothetical protein
MFTVVSSKHSCGVTLCRSSSNPDMHTVGGEDDEINALARGLDRTSSMRTGELHSRMYT